MSAPEQKVAGTAMALAEPPTDDQIEQLRKRGAAVVAHRQEVAKLEKQIAGLEWGTGSMAVRGSSLSPMTRAVFAEFCALVRANPMYHVDVLGSRPYLNSNYWSDLINSRPDFHHYDQRDLSPSVEKALRDRAARHRELAKELAGQEAAQRLARALDLEEEADDVALARAQWSAPVWAQVVIQTTVWKFIDVAPLDAIRRGEITDLDRYLVAVHECNWAGGKPKAKKRDGGEYEADPIGNAEPAKTARTRSLRRAAVKAFSAWMQAYEQQIQKAEEAIEAEFTVVRSERAAERAALPAANEAQAVRSGNGEPKVTRTEAARELPVEEARAPEPVPHQNEQADEPTSKAETPAEFTAEFTTEGARKMFFDALRDLAIDDRQKWMADHQLPDSTKKWGREHWERALELLLGPERKRLREGASIAGQDSEQLARDTFGRPVEFLRLRELQQLSRHVASLVDSDDAQGRLV